MQHAEPIDRFHEFVCIGRDIDSEIVAAEIHLKGRESALQRRSSLRQADPRRRPGAVHPDRLGEIDDPRLVLVDEDVEGAQVAMDHAGPRETPDQIEHPVEEFFWVLEHNVLESRSGPFLRAEVSHREAVLDAPRGCRHTDPAFPGLDRKSTRLNSSHRTISYAVFCLKKKKKEIKIEEI